MNTPIYNSIKEYSDSGTLPFHMPGHKLGAGLPAYFKKNLAALDLTEIPGTDNLHNARDVIYEAQVLAAGAFGAVSTFFLVNGSTCGIHSMISTICKRGDSLIVSRDCHKSVITGMMLSGVNPVYILPEYDELFGITTHVKPETVEKALGEHPEAAGVLLVRPNFYGICSDIEEISKIVHKYGKVLAIDEAHGAHFKFGENLPMTALAGGADICVQSAHKTLPALTQGSYLHVGSDRIDIERLKFYLRTYQTSSPSYIIMASLDLARAIMQKDGNKLLAGLYKNINEAMHEFNHPGLCFYDESYQGCPEGRCDSLDKTQPVYRDYSRVVLNTRKLGISGFEAEGLLRREYGIQVEMADMYNVVCITTSSDAKANITALFKAFNKLALSHEGRPFFYSPADIAAGVSTGNSTAAT
ncbi:MAG: aminotransferase class I/II-fold pyridoxal phosphate-dependent enzyme, partial [Clostridiales bacterium]|nr:aminotransferase class I/II-fold pyridoxal phosphate-dependent enzyme [Clostridiales bacterium]